MKRLMLLALAPFLICTAQDSAVSILYFTGDACTPCQQADEVLRRMQARYGTQQLAIVNMRIDEHALAAKALGVRSIPTLFLNGRRMDGVIDEAAFRRTIDLSLGKLIADDVAVLDLNSAPKLGSSGPEITVFSDFQCPYCSAIAPVLRQLAESGDAVVRFKNFPLSFHAKAPLAHRAAIAAAKQGKFWEMHDRIFESPSKLDSASFEAYAGALGLDVAQFRADLSLSSNLLASDLAEGERVGVEGTPAVYIEGRSFLGRPTLENLRAALKTLSPATRVPQLPLTTLLEDANATQTLEWFFDAQSDLTRASAETIRELLETAPIGVRVLARHFPQTFHTHSRKAHEALALAGNQDKFWPLLHLMLRQSANGDPEQAKSLAMRAGLDAAGFSRLLDDGAAASAVERDISRARELGVKGTPTFVLNGQAVSGIPSVATLLDLLTNSKNSSSLSAAARGVNN